MTSIAAEVLDGALRSGVEFLHRQQLPTGEIPTQLGSDMALLSPACVFDSSPFVTTLVLHALSHTHQPLARTIITRGLTFLEREMEPGGLWRYYASGQWKHGRIPPDLDDTACASYLLREHGRPLPDNRWVFRALRTDDGLYPTWIMPSLSQPRLWLTRWIGDRRARRAELPKPAEARDNPRFQTDTDPVSADEIDAVVNANVVLYLGETPDTQAAIRFLIDQIRGGEARETSVYYPDALALFYMIARARLHSAPSLAEIGPFVVEDTTRRQHPDGSFGSALATALAACTLLTFDANHAALPTAIESLLDTQGADGSWPRYTLYRGYAECWGSEELTTGFCTEALARYRGRLPGCNGGA